jgi:L-2-hydroxyglutarate oxidase LhgO
MKRYKTMKNRTGFLIVGAGIIGLAIGREILRSHPNSIVTIIDKEVAAGQHASTLNSGVVHAGIYYEPTSLKAQLSVNGNHLMREFISEHNIPWINSGKVVVARNQRELSNLEIIYERGISNGVELHQVSENQLKKIEPIAKTHKFALWSPSTAVANSVALMKSLVSEFESLGGKLLLGVEFLDAEEGCIKTNVGQIAFEHLINAGGLHADKIARKFGFSKDYGILPFAGIYFKAPALSGILKTHVYPTPDFNYPFLGVHLTRSWDSSVKVGPSAIPLLGREQYNLTSPINIIETKQIVSGLVKFGLNPENNWANLAKSEVKHLFKKLVSDEVKTLLQSGVDLGEISRQPKIGIRAQLFSKRNGKLEMDFVLEGDDKSTHILNAVSPGWTCSFSMAQHVVSILANRNII